MDVETGLITSDQDVSVHDAFCRIRRLMLTYDWLSANELVCDELVGRCLEMAECRH